MNKTMKVLIVKADFPHARIIVGIIWELDNRIGAALAPCAFACVVKGYLPELRQILVDLGRCRQS